MIYIISNVIFIEIVNIEIYEKNQFLRFFVINIDVVCIVVVVENIDAFILIVDLINITINSV